MLLVDVDVAQCQKCLIRRHCNQVVFGEGSIKSPIVFVAEAPGFVEDCIGRPLAGLNELRSSRCVCCADFQNCFSWFIGNHTGKNRYTKCRGFVPVSPADLSPISSLKTGGQIYDDLLQSCNIDRSKVWTTNLVLCRPPGNRTPTPEEIANCSEFLSAQLRDIRPTVVVCLGLEALRFFAPKEKQMGKSKGKIFSYEVADPSGPFSIKVVATWHPAYVLRQVNEYSSAASDYHRKEELKSQIRQLKWDMYDTIQMALSFLTNEIIHDIASG